MSKLTKGGQKARHTWARKQWYQEFCDCRGHKEVINPDDCLCSPDNAEDLKFCKRITEERREKNELGVVGCDICREHDRNSSCSDTFISLEDLEVSEW